MNAVAYCRVSTNKDEQIDSLEAQQKFFLEYAKKNDFNLIKIYADEGKSGTKIKNRTQLLKLLSDANKKMFDVVLIKDVSRLARNTVDFLTSIRKLKSLSIKVIFVNYDQTSSDSSEFMLTMLSAIAQEESANTSKRVKFGKKMNAEKGRVPNIVYGYDKIAGDYFNLYINPFEANVVRRIFNMYTNDNYGANKISFILNKEGIKTKRNCKWSQNAISRILSNKLYTGKVLNGKEEVVDFLTGERKSINENDWIITENKNLKIIDDESFDKAQRILNQRSNAFKITGERRTDKYPFSKLIKCAHCGYSFRRIERTYVNTYIRWVCSGRNAKGMDSCPNKTSIEEYELLQVIKDYFSKILKDKSNVANNILSEFTRLYKARDENIVSEKEVMAALNKLKKVKHKYVDMFENDIITIAELKDKNKNLNEDISKLEYELKIIRLNINKSDLFSNVLNKTFKNIESILNVEYLTNEMLNKVIEKIVVDENGKISIHLRLFCEIGIDNIILTSDDCT